MIHLLSLVGIILFAFGAVAKVNFTWPCWDFKTESFRPPQLKINKTSDEAIEPGLLFIGLKHNLVENMLPAGDAATIYDQEGNLIWHGPDVETTNLRAQTLFGKPVLTYWTGVKIEGYGYGAIHILDQKYQEIYTVKLQTDMITPEGTPLDSYIDLHESKITDKNTMLITAYNLTQFNVNEDPTGVPVWRWVIDSQFYEIDIQTNDVLFSWSALNHRDQIPISSSHLELLQRGTNRTAPFDVYHINSVDPVESGYLISLRHIFAAVYVNRDGSVQWVLEGATGGDFSMCPTCHFAWQHDIRVFNEADNSLTLTIFNNAGTPQHRENFTTGLFLTVDLHNMTVTDLRTLIDPEDQIHADTQGSLQIFTGNTGGNALMGYGQWATIKEYDARGIPVFTAKFGPDAQIASYRVAKHEWHATPHWNPSVQIGQLSTAPSGPSNDLAIYVSWNGATDYDHWAVYGADAVDVFDRRLLAFVERTGFETEIILTNAEAKYLQAVPMQDGKALTASTVVDVLQPGLPSLT